MRHLAFLFYGFVAAATIYGIGWPLLGDYRAAIEGTVAADGWRIDQATCETDWMVVTRCRIVALAAPGDAAEAGAGTPGRRFSATYVLLGRYTPPAEIELLRRASDTSEIPHIATSFGQESLQNRSLAVLLLALLLVGLVYVNTGERSPASVGQHLGARLRHRRNAGANGEPGTTTHRRPAPLATGAPQPRPRLKPVHVSRVKSNRPLGLFR